METEEIYYFFPRKYVWLIGIFQKIGFFNIHFYSDANFEYIRRILEFYHHQMGIQSRFGFISREQNPNYEKHKKDLETIRQYVKKELNVELEGSIILVDDKKDRSVNGQDIYDISKMKNNRIDYGIIKMLIYIYCRCVYLDCKKLITWGRTLSATLI